MFSNLPNAVRLILIGNILLFLITQTYGPVMVEYLGLWFIENPNFEYWQLVSHMFMHGGFAHILFNMYALVAFGGPLERIWGSDKFYFFYFSAGLGAALLHTAVNYYNFQTAIDAIVESGVNRFDLMQALTSSNGADYNVLGNEVPYHLVEKLFNSFAIPAVGASGAIYGILVAFAFMYSEARLMLLFFPVPIKAKYFVPLVILGDFYFGISNASTGVAHFAHIGGALLGFIMMWYWKKNQFNNNRWD
tara:strand:+ start:5395 stop:6138 length:744 start_codon:yes stop_codon:yes gene_type:complete